MAKKNESLAEFESKLEQLENLVRALEDGEAGLEETIRNFEQGMALAKSCESLLKAASLRVEALMEDEQGEQLVPLEEDDDEAEP